MRNIDLSPLYRTIVGFDRVANLIEAAARQEQAPNWPPYNVIQTSEDDYRIEIAVAGFAEADLDIELKEGLLTIKGDKSQSLEEQKYLHRGIAERAFERKFQLADHVKVISANLANGLLVVELHREIPLSAKPHKIIIGAQNQNSLELVKDEQAA
jgi:molecular chaperone IbpA